MKKLLFLFFTLTISSYTYSQVTSFNNLPISRVLLFDMSDNPDQDNALTVPIGKLWYIQQVSAFKSSAVSAILPTYAIAKLEEESIFFGQGAVLSEGTKIFRSVRVYINIIEYDLDAQTIALNTNDIKLDNKMQLFPNPTNSRLSLNSEKDYNIEVFDLTGRKIMEAQGNNLDMSNLSKATYIVKAFDKASKETYSYKVIRN
ncbi:T9SS type A sorting domain-containing protein [Polaribacter sp.]|nr:T9SS type A sorting domain-containing protein [Polaribacter sp.]